MGSPTARQFRFTRELGDEVVVLDDGERVAHHLTAEAAAVWRACDGRSDAAAIATRTGLDAARVETVVDQLGERGLLAPDGTTRRAVLRRAMVTGAVVAGGAAITSVLVPTAAEAFTSQPGTQGTHSDSSQNPGGQPVGGSSVEQPATGPGGPVKASHGSSGPSPTGSTPEVSGSGHKTGGLGGPGAGELAGAGGTVPLPKGQLPFTGTNVVRTAVVGGALVAAGTAGHIAARRHADAPPDDTPAVPAG